MRCFTVAVGLGLCLSPMALSRYHQAYDPCDLYPYKLTRTQAQEVSQTLSTWGVVDHTVAADEITVKVPPEMRAQLLMRLSLKRIPHADPGGMQGSVTDTSQEAKARRLQLLSARLEESIRCINGVNDARVTIAIPEDRWEAPPPTASVFLTLAPDVNLNPEQVSGVAFMVASAIPEMSPEKVSVVGNDGKSLKRKAADGGEEQLGEFQLQLQKQFDTYLAQKCQEMLDSAFGVGRSKVHVNCLFDFSQMEVKRTNVGRPGEGETVVVEQKVDESFKRPRSVEGLEQEDAPSAGNGTNYQKVCEARRFKNDEAFTFTVFRTPRIQRLSAAVSINLKGQEANARTLVMGALGFDESRGDYLGVAFVPGPPSIPPFSPPPPAHPLMEMRPVHPAWAALLALPGLALVGLWLMGREVHRRRSEVIVDVNLTRPTPQGLTDLTHPALGPTRQSSQAETASLLQTRLEDLARDKPGQALAGLRTLLKTRSNEEHG